MPDAEATRVFDYRVIRQVTCCMDGIPNESNDDKHHEDSTSTYQQVNRRFQYLLGAALMSNFYSLRWASYIIINIQYNIRILHSSYEM